jgi:hypothetical protein
MAGCRASDTRDERLRVQPPFAEATIWSDSLYIRLMPEERIGGMVLLSVAPLSAGMTAEEAAATLGRPVATRTDQQGTYYTFAGCAPSVELAHLQFRDSGPVDKWVITARPAANAASTLLAPGLGALLERSGEVGELTVHEQRGAASQAFTARVSGGLLYDIQWYRIGAGPGG